MKGARRTRKPRQQAGFADLMTSSPSNNSLRGVVTGVSRAQRSTPSTPSTPTRTPSNPTTPPPLDDDWGALLHTTPKRRFSPQKPVRATNAPQSSSSRSSSTVSQRRTPSLTPPRQPPSTPSPRRTPTTPSPRRTPSTPSPRHTPPPVPPSIRNCFASSASPSPKSSTTSHTRSSAPVPAFLSGWDGADGWGQDPPLDDSDHETQNDPWGVWPDDDILSQPHPNTVPPPSSKHAPTAETPKTMDALPATEHTPVAAQPAEHHDPPTVAPVPPEQTITNTTVEPHPGHDEPVAHSSVPRTEPTPESVYEPPYQPEIDDSRLISTREETHPVPTQPTEVSQQPETIQTPSGSSAFDSPNVTVKEEQPGTLSPPKPQPPKDEAQLNTGFVDFTGWAVEEPPQQAVVDFPVPAQQTAATHSPGSRDGSVPATGWEGEQPKTVAEAEAQVPGSETDAAAGFDTFSGWAVDEPPQQAAVDFPVPVTQQSDTAQSTESPEASVPATGWEGEQPKAVAPAEAQVPKIETGGAAGFDTFSGWTVEETPQQAVVDFPVSAAGQSDAAQSPRSRDAIVPATSWEVEQPKTIAAAEAQVPKNETGAAAGFDFSGWAVEEPLQQAVVDFPVPVAQQSDAAHSPSSQDGSVPVTGWEGEQPKTVAEAEAQVPKSATDAAAGFDTFSGWTVEEPPQQAVIDSPVPVTPQSDAAHSPGSQEAGVPATGWEGEQPETAQTAGPLVPKDETDAAEGFDFSGWAVEEPPQQPADQFPALEIQQNDTVHSTEGQDAGVPIAFHGDQRLPEGVPEIYVSVPAIKESEVHEAQRMATIEAAAHHRTNLDESATPAAEASAQPAPTKTSLAIDPWSFNETKAAAPAGDAGWRWGEPDSVPPTEPEPVEKPIVSEHRPATVSSNTTAQTASTSCTVAASVLEERMHEALEKPIDVPREQTRTRAEPPRNDLRNIVRAEQSTSVENGWGTNEGANEVNLDDWGWGAQADGEADEFNIAVNSTVQGIGPHPSAFSHVSATEAPAKDSTNFGADHSFREKETTVHNGRVNPPQGEPNSNAANAYDTANTDFSMYAPSKGNTERGRVDFAEAQQIGNASHPEDLATVDRSDSKSPSGQSEFLRDGLVANPHSKEGFGEEGAATRHQESAWTTNVALPDLNVSSINTDPNLVASGVSPPAGKDGMVKDAVNSGSHAQVVAKVSQEKSKDSFGGPDNSSFLWSAYEDTPKPEADRSWANPDAIWSAPPVSPPSAVEPENKNRKDAYWAHEPPADTKGSSKDTSDTRLPSIQPPQPRAGVAPVSIAAPDVSMSSFENNASYSPIQQDMFQHYAGEPRETSTPSDSKISGSEMHSTEASSEKSKQNKDSMGAVDWQQSCQANLQPQMPARSGVGDSVLSKNSTLSNAYWTERLDESKSEIPVCGYETVPQTSDEYQEPKRHESASWSPSHKTSQAEPVTKLALSYSDSNTGSVDHDANRTQMTDSGTVLWPSSADPHHRRGPPNMQYAAPELAHEGSDRATQLEIAQKPPKIEYGVSLHSNEDREEGPTSENSTTDAVTVGKSPSANWNQYAPRADALGGQNPLSVSSPQTEPSLPVRQPTSEKKITASTTMSASPQMSTYDPFAVYQDESAVDKTKASYEAFDWGYGTQEPSSNFQIIAPALPNAEGQEANEAGSWTHQDTARGEQSSTHNADLQSKSIPSPSTPNTEANVHQPPVHVFPGALQTQNALQMDSQASYNWNNPGGLRQSHEKRSALAEKGPGEDSTGLQPELSAISSPVDPVKVDETEPRMNREGVTCDAASTNTCERMARSSQNPQPSSIDVDVDYYAPRTNAVTHPADPSAAVQQNAFNAFGVLDNEREFPQMTAPMEMSTPQKTSQQINASVYQAAIPDAPSSYSLGASYAPSIPPVPPTVTLSGSGYLQTGNEAIQFASPPVVPGTLLGLEQSRTEVSTSASQPSGHSTIPACQVERPQVRLANASNENPGPYQNGRDAGLSSHGLNGQPHVSNQSLDHQAMSHETVLQAPVLGTGPWSAYGPREVPGATSVAAETATTQWNHVGTAYNNAGNSTPEQPGGHTAIVDEATKAQDAYAMPDEPSYSQGPPPPPQQATYARPSFLREEDVFHGEPMLDPSVFQYPYSIMDSEVSGDFSTRPKRAVFSWGLGGKLVTFFPHVNGGPEGAVPQDRASSDATSASTVHIHDLKDIAQDGSNDDWAAASEAVPPISFPTRTSDLSKYAEMCDRLSRLSVGLKGAEAEGRAALWRVLALCCREGTSNWRIHASSAVSGPSSVPMFGRTDSSLLPSNSKLGTIFREDQLDSNGSGTKKTEAAIEVERLLTLGKSMDAINVAQEAGLWSIALVLATTVDRSIYLKVVSGYAKSVLQDGSSLQTLCLSVAEDESEILRKATSPSGLKEWRKTVGTLLSTMTATRSSGDADAQQSRILRLIDHIGEALISQNSDFVAGHVCFLISGRLGPLDESNIQLLGADPQLPAGRPRGLGSPAAVLQSLVLEAIENAANGTTYPHLLPHRLVLAEEICAVGRPEVALAHCESISSAVRNIFESGRRDIASQYFTLPFLSRLESLEQRLLVLLGKVESGTKRGGLTALGKSLSSVFTKRLTTDSRSGQPTRGENRAEPTDFARSRSAVPPPPQSGRAASPPLYPIVSSEHLPPVAPASNWAPNLDIPALRPQSADQSSNIQSGPPVNDVSQNEGWNSLVSKTIGFLAPAEGDLSPPLKARNDQGVPFHSQPTPLGLGGGATGEVPTLDPHTGHMRSASVGDVPMLQQQEPTIQMHQQSNYSHQVFQGAHSQRDNTYASVANRVDQAVFNGVPVQETTAVESSMSPTHRRAASDMTFESQTSEKKPPRPPKKSPTLPSGAGLQPKKEKVQAVKGWRSRLSEKIRAAFSGPPRAHMGVENKFKYDKERGRWVIEGEDPDENNDEPPPPPEDEPTLGGPTPVPFSQSYESLPNPDLGNHFASSSHVAPYQSDNELSREGARRYSHSGQMAFNNMPLENGYSRDTGSESSVASAASAPAPYMSEPTPPVLPTPGNKFRARSGRASGRRAYVDTFNKGTPPVAMSAAFPNPARPRPPTMNGLGSQAGGTYRIFTPSPAPVSHESINERSSVPGSGGAPVTSSTVDSNENMYQTRANPPSERGFGLRQMPMA